MRTSCLISLRGAGRTDWVVVGVHVHQQFKVSSQTKTGGFGSTTDIPSRASRACQTPSRRLGGSWRATARSAGRCARRGCLPCPCWGRKDYFPSHRRYGRRTGCRCSCSAGAAGRGTLRDRGRQFKRLISALPMPGSSLCDCYSRSSTVAFCRVVRAELGGRRERKVRTCSSCQATIMNKLRYC